MPYLSAAQRSQLEKTCIKARQWAETGARNALHTLAVDEAEPYAHLTPDDRNLRNRLRHRARLLGDERMPDGRHSIDHLAAELAYEFWHRMLFARFLIGSDLLMHPDGVAVTLEDCDELAPEEGHADKWAAAAHYASLMLPAIFRPDDPLMQVDFATEDRIRLETLLDNLDNAYFTADDALGWVYQFWQSEAKDRINASGDKIDGSRLPAVTQLFTEPYMVRFLIDNTIGAWWTASHPDEPSPVPFRYLRFTPDTPRPKGGLLAHEQPSAQLYERQQAPFRAGGKNGSAGGAADITFLDPSMGSGHIVVEVFRVLVALRSHEEGLPTEAAIDAVLTDNIHGLELDPRCTQIAAFNLALAAWRLGGRYRPLPRLNLACAGLAPVGKKDDWIRLVDEADKTRRDHLRNGMADLYDLFQKAPTLGSLLDPTTLVENAITAPFSELLPSLQAALAHETADEQRQRGVMALGIAEAGRLLARKYTLQLTNVPYLARGKQAPELADYCARHFADAKNDLATVFLERMLRMAERGGTVATVIPQNWLFLTSYKDFRKRLLLLKQWDWVARLGPGAFKEISGEVVKAILVSLSNQKPDEQSQFWGIDVSEQPNPAEKDAALLTAEVKTLNQTGQLKNPDIRVVLENSEGTELLEKYAESPNGLHGGDSQRFRFFFWEVDSGNKNWRFLQNTTDTIDHFSGRENIFYWPDNGKIHHENPNARIQGDNAWNKQGVTISMMRDLPCTRYTGELFDISCSPIVPKDPDHLPAIWAFCSSPDFNREVRKIDQKLNVTNATLVKVPFDLEHWQKVAAEQYPRGLPQPYSDDPTQWLFHGHPIPSTAPLQVAVARLLGYRWPAESDPDMELSGEAHRHIAAIRPHDHLTDEDGILCLPPVNGELAAEERLREYLRAVWGPEYDAHTIGELLKQAGSKKATLGEWLRDEFMESHNKLFGHRPFIWHIWDGRRDGFGALVNYHRLTRANLQKLIYTYLGDYIRQCESRRQAGESGADGQLLAAQQLQQKLMLILEGDAPYDIFVRWKKLSEQPVGWNPDLNDGVRLNIRPFMLADVLRKKPNIKWGIDRGRNAPGAPWGEIRDNDRHLTLAEKR
ncbi:type II restriction endonuclease subunit M [Fibrisoma montanum]|uniref:site-specific DNA-methyltransferase (adenine-specific) n=1 Tax=Fibrisoma montanum TaxID=2305895 RepID=A0A418MIV3_9BACT|nr:N-6 DNA methylase [Fibrisoma montanum]RIV27360.1 type II restriction endonuclease subunit M [Fibrisoma montanum]